MDEERQLLQFDFTHALKITTHMGDLHYNKTQLKSFTKGRDINLNQKELEILWLLASHPTETFSSEDIIETIMECGMMIHEKKFIELMTSNISKKAGVAFIKKNQLIRYENKNKYMP